MSLETSQFDAGSSALAHLSDEQRRRLSDTLERYLSALENGAPLSQTELLAEHADLADTLQSYFRSLELLHDMAGGIGSSTPLEPTPTNGQQRVGDFELLREIGRGGMGVVYEARQLSLGRRVAVKLLPFASVLDSRQIARFKYEAQAAAQLQHPNIVSVFAVGVDAGVHYYAMPLIEGRPLDQVIREERESRSGRRRSRLDAAISIGIQAADALQAAHENGVVHRDIKPSNLLLEPNGKAWVTDFGLARCQREASLTRTGDLVGTLRYMSPEQAAGRAELVDHRTDVYSLGATLYELLCLRPAFEDRTGPGLLRQIEAHEPPRPRQLRAEIPAHLETVVLKAMARNRDDRYATAREFADDLRRVQAGQPILAQPMRWLERIGRRARRHQTAILVAFGLSTVACLGFAVSTFLIARESRRAEQHLVAADRRFREAREVVDRFGVDLSQQLAGVDGAENVRRELLSQAEKYYRDFIDDARTDPRLRSELAHAYGRIAVMVEEAGSAEEAVTAHQTAVRMFAELAAADPQALTPHKRLALARNNLGLALARTGKFAKARDEFDAAIKSQAGLAERFPINAELSSDLAVSHSNLGLLLQETGDEQAARGSYQAAEKLLNRLLAAEPANTDLARRSASVLNNLAGTYVKSAPREAIALHQRALSLQTATARREAENPALRREIALTYHNLGAAFGRTRDLEQSLANYEQAVVLLEDLVATSPGKLANVRDLAVTTNNIGLVHMRARALEKAEAAFRRSIQLHEQLVKRSPQDADAWTGAAGAHSNLAVALERLGRTRDSVAAAESAVRCQETALGQSPNSVRRQKLLEAHRSHVTRLKRESANEPEGFHEAS